MWRSLNCRSFACPKAFPGSQSLPFLFFTISRGFQLLQTIRCLISQSQYGIICSLTTQSHRVISPAMLWLASWIGCSQRMRFVWRTTLWIATVITQRLIIACSKLEHLTLLANTLTECYNSCEITSTRVAESINFHSSHLRASAIGIDKWKPCKNMTYWNVSGNSGSQVVATIALAT
jgi:hypothetical protein